MIKSSPPLIFLLLVIGIMAWGANAEASSVEVFATHNEIIRGLPKDVLYCRVDDLSQLTDALNHGLSSNLIKDRVNQIAIDTACLNRAIKLGITKVPAIVFNEEAVVYGAYDFNTALMLFNQREGNLR